MRLIPFLCVFLVFLCFSTAKAEPLEKKVKFIQISDVHLHQKAKNRGSRMYAHSEELFIDAIAQVNGIDDVDFVVFTGDMIGYPDKPLLKYFLEKASGLKYPWFCTIGNHDINSQSLDKNDFVTILKESGNFNNDKSYYSKQVDDFVFLFMDGSIEKENTANGYFSGEELDWLEEKLNQHKDSYVVIFQHYPVVEPFSSATHKILNSDKYLAVIDKYDNVIAVITGHYHSAKITMRKGVAHISSPALVQYPNAFRVFTLEKNNDFLSLSYGFLPVTQKDIREKSFHLIKSVRLYEGMEEDRNGTLILRKFR